MYTYCLSDSLTRNLSQAREKIQALESQIDQLLTKKNSRIHELESKVRNLEHMVSDLNREIEEKKKLHDENLVDTVESLRSELTQAHEELEELLSQ